MRGELRGASCEGQKAFLVFETRFSQLVTLVIAPQATRLQQVLSVFGGLLETGFPFAGIDGFLVAMPGGVAEHRQ